MVRLPLRTIGWRKAGPHHTRVTPYLTNTRSADTILHVTKAGDEGLMRDLAQAYARLGNIQSRTGTANLGQIEQARQSYQRALDLYAGLGLSAGAPPTVAAPPRTRCWRPRSSITTPTTKTRPR